MPPTGNTWFPLSVGRQWVYRVSGRLAPAAIAAVTVNGTRTRGGREYFVLSGFPEGDLLVRLGAGGKLIVWNAGNERERLWVDFSAAAGSTFPLAGDVESCTESAEIEARGVEYKGPAATSHEAMRISYTPRCRDAGLVEDIVVPGAGLVRRTWTSLAGPVVWELTRSSLTGSAPGQDK